MPKHQFQTKELEHPNTVPQKERFLRNKCGFHALSELHTEESLHTANAQSTVPRYNGEHSITKVRSTATFYSWQKKNGAIFVLACNKPSVAALTSRVLLEKKNAEARKHHNSIFQSSSLQSSNINEVL